MLTRCLIGMYIIFQQFRVVVAHLLEVRHDPAFVHGVTVKTSGQLVIDAAVRHVLKRGDDQIAKRRIVFVRG